MNDSTRLPDVRIGMFATPHDLGAVTSSAAKAAAGQRAALQASLLRQFPAVTPTEFRRMLIQCPQCEHAISVGKFMETQNCTQCRHPILNPNGMFHLALRAMLRLSKTPTQDFMDLIAAVPRARPT